jgi:hypothetical protein
MSSAARQTEIESTLNQIMGMMGQTRTGCSQCGAGDKAITRTEGHYRFCSTCYARLFKKRGCVQCGKVSRIFATLSAGKCRDCSRGPRVCHRCSKPFARAGKLVDNKWICPSCAIYFTNPKTCDHCGTSSVHVSHNRSSGLPGLVCASCAGRNRRSCSHCGKPRSVFVDTESGPLCRPCAELPGVTHICPDCLVSVPGSGNSRCDNCGAVARVRTRSQLLAATFSTDRFRYLWTDFVEWRIAKVGGRVASLGLDKEAATFGELERSGVSELAAVEAERLLALFPVNRWRSATNVQSFLSARFGITFSAESKARLKSQQALAQTLEQIWSASVQALLEDYAQHLQSSKSPIKPRTQRMYVSTAARFMQRVGATSVEDLADAKKLAWVIRQYPSMYTSLCRFLSWCKATHNVAIVFDKPQPRTTSHHRSTVLAHKTAVAFEILASAVASQPRREGAAIFLLAKLYQWRQQDLCALRMRDIIHTADGQALVTSAGRVAQVDARLADFLRGKLIGTADTYVFPGRVPGTHIAEPPKFMT